MHGSTDVKEIMTWCNIITSLKRYAQDIDQDELISHIRTMNTTSGYYWLVKEVFGKWAKLLSHQATFAEDVENAITMIKSVMPKEMIGYKKEKVIIKKSTSIFSWTELLGIPIVTSTQQPQPEF